MPPPRDPCLLRPEVRRRCSLHEYGEHLDVGDGENEVTILSCQRGKGQADRDGATEAAQVMSGRARPAADPRGFNASVGTQPHRFLLL